jgi:hypothetical protein
VSVSERVRFCEVHRCHYGPRYSGPYCPDPVDALLAATLRERDELAARCERLRRVAMLVKEWSMLTPGLYAALAALLPGDLDEVK